MRTAISGNCDKIIQWLNLFNKKMTFSLKELKKVSIFAPAFRAYLMRPKSGEMAERSNAAVLKTVEGHTSGGSNPSFSAEKPRNTSVYGALFLWVLN